MKYKMIVSAPAKSDILAIKNYISADNPGAAEKVSVRILKSLASIESSPHIGGSAAERFNIETDLLYFVALPYKYIIFYKLDGQAINVIRVLDGRRDCIRALGLRDSSEFGADDL